MENEDLILRISGALQRMDAENAALRLILRAVMADLLSRDGDAKQRLRQWSDQALRTIANSVDSGDPMKPAQISHATAFMTRFLQHLERDLGADPAR